MNTDGRSPYTSDKVLLGKLLLVSKFIYQSSVLAMSDQTHAAGNGELKVTLQDAGSLVWQQPLQSGKSKSSEWTYLYNNWNKWFLVRWD